MVPHRRRCAAWRSSLAFLFWPHEYRAPGDPGYVVYALYTPVIGITLGLAILALGVAVIQYVKKFFPDEVSIQQRHDGPSDEVARRTVIAQLVQAGKDTGIGRRGMILGTAGLAAGIFGHRARHRRGRPAGAQPVEGRAGRRALALPAGVR